jgi:hypothetical protein
MSAQIIRFPVVATSSKTPKPGYGWAVPVGHNPTLWYRVCEANGGLVFARAVDAQQSHDIHTALGAKTWGEFRRLMPADAYMELMERKYEYADELSAVPSDHDEFSSDWVPGFCDGDYPDWLQAKMGEILPVEILDQFAVREQSVLNGPYWKLDPKCEAEVVDALRAAGYAVTKREDLAFL